MKAVCPKPTQVRVGLPNATPNLAGFTDHFRL